MSCPPGIDWAKLGGFHLTNVPAEPYRRVLEDVTLHHTVKAVAEYTGVSRESLGRIRNRKLTTIKATTAEKLRRMVELLPSESDVA